MSNFTVAILTVSDTAFTSPTSDRSGPALVAFFEALPSSPYTVVATAIVADEATEIRDQVKRWCEDGISLILTSGGTGFGQRDVTPEAVAPLITKPAPGLVILMINHSLKIIPTAALSRPVAGVCVLPGNASTGRGSIIVTLPGSPKGATENLEVLLRILPHALELATGGTGATLHSTMRVEERGAPSTTIPATHSHDHAGCSHGHHAPTPRTVVSQDPASDVASRQRHSPYPLLPVHEALALILGNTRIVKISTVPVDDNLVGYVLAEDIEATKNIPDRPTTNVDGYAVRSSDPIGTYKVQTEYAPVPPGSIYRINTGAPLPIGTDAVIMVEDTLVASRQAEGEEETVQILAQVDARENTRDVGSDVKRGEKVLEAGDVVSAVGGEIGTLAFVGKRSVRVHRRPVIAVLSTGNELVDVQDTSSLHSASSFSAIPDSNRPSLISILKHLHFDVIDLGIVSDSMESTTKALKKGMEQSDVIISTGGTSMGVGDLLKPCIEQEMKGTVHFGRVAMKPGKPTTFATIPAHPMAPNSNPRLVFALPGNPASALVTFFLFVLPALRKMEGRRQVDWELPRMRVALTSDIRLDSRAEYQRVQLRPTKSRQGPSLQAYSTGGQRSSRTVSLAGANGLLELPIRSEAVDKLEAGQEVSCVIIGEMVM